MTSKTGQKIITIYTLANISKSIGSQEMKFGQLIKYSMRYIFIKNHAENEVGRLVPDLSLFFKKALCSVKASGQYAYCNYLLSNLQVINFEINHSFLIKPFFCINK